MKIASSKHLVRSSRRQRLILALLIIFGLSVALLFVIRESETLKQQQQISQITDAKEWALEKIHAKEAWKVSTGKGVKIAVIDSGFDIARPEMAEKIVEIDYDTSLEDTPADLIGHGTQTSSIIAGPTGVCPDCQLIVIKIGENNNEAGVTNAIFKAADYGANVINLSVITDYDEITQAAIDYAWDHGAVLIAAAGNEKSSRKLYPAAYAHVISVAATDQQDKKAAFSNFGKWITIAAPGVDIYTYQNDRTTDYVSGTSFAAPIAAGVAGLIWSSKYGTSNEAVAKRLCDTADDIHGTRKYWQCGRINAARAVEAIPK